VASNLDEGTGTQFISDELGAIGRDSHKPTPGLALAFGEVIRKPRLHGIHFPLDICLKLEHHGAEQRVGSAMHLGKANLLVDSEVVCAETMVQHLADHGAHVVVAGPRNQRGDKLR
jgi:hypothetical protein